MTSRATLAFPAGALALLLTAQGAAHASDKPKGASPEGCGAAWKEARAREAKGQLRGARDVLRACAKPACGSLVAQQCSSRLARLETDIPTVVPVVTDPDGAPVLDVEVDVDGAVLSPRIDGQGREVDPGLHEFSFRTKDGVFAAVKALVVEGQRNRELSVVMRPAATSPVQPAARVEVAASEEPRNEFDPLPDLSMLDDKPARPAWALPRSPLPYALAGLGVTSVGAGVLFTVWGNRDNGALGQCSPNCSPSSVSHIRTLYLASDVAFGLGAVSLGVAGWLFATSRAPEPAARRSAFSFGVAPTPSGAVGSVGGVF
jgi:hypothetical protein